MGIASVYVRGKVGKSDRRTNIEASEPGVSAFRLVVVRCHCREGAACFINFRHSMVFILSLRVLKVDMSSF